jgi:hypothetical protein
MPSPFPGMDPYLEAPHIWPDLQHALAVSVSQVLNKSLPKLSYARLDARHEIGIIEADGRRDLRVEALDSEPVRHLFVEIRDASRDHRLVTLIEILSPSNKRPGPDRDAYVRKQREVLESDASLVEIDLLRDGRRVFPDGRLAEFIDKSESRPAYVILVSPAWRREAPYRGYVVYPVRLRDPLPRVGIPLKAELPLLLLDLQLAFHLVYDGGPYRLGAVDYTIPPTPPLTGEDAAWAEAILREHAGPPA